MKDKTKSCVWKLKFMATILKTNIEIENFLCLLEICFTRKYILSLHNFTFLLLQKCDYSIGNYVVYDLIFSLWWTIVSFVYVVLILFRTQFGLFDIKIQH